jgi:5-formyltetrahydrofolate cyclo-ligase
MVELGTAAPKSAWRAALLAERYAVPETVRQEEGEALRAGLAADLRARGLAAGDTVCAHVPRPPEPGSLRLAEALREQGLRVLLPVSGDAGVLDWAPYTGQDGLVTGRYGLSEPSAAREGPRAVCAARLMLIPALAVDGRGVRLGRGAGYYDRALGLLTPGTPVIAVVRDGEVVTSLPSEPHDVRVSGVLTPERGVCSLHG